MESNKLERNIRKVSDVSAALRRSCKDSKPATLLIGAGCSISGKVPTALQIVNKFKDAYSDNYLRAEYHYKNDHPNDDQLIGIYPYFMAELAPAERDSIINSLIESEVVNWTHLAIAQLIRSGYVGRVLTVNFDRLAVKATALLNVFPAVYDRTAIKTAFEQNVIAERLGAIFYLHGQGQAMPLTHRHEDSREQMSELRDFLRDSLQRGPVIVVGYSGLSDPIFDLLKSQRSFRHGLYWANYSSEIPEHVADLMLKDGASCLINQDSDEFFIELCNDLECFPPKIISQPLESLDDTFKGIAAFPNKKDRTIDPLAIARQVIRSSIDNNPQKQIDIFKLEIMEKFMQSDTDRVIELGNMLTDPFMDDEIRSALSISYATRAVSQIEESRKKNLELAQKTDILKNSVDSSIKALDYKETLEALEAYLWSYVDYSNATGIGLKDNQEEIITIARKIEFDYNSEDLYNVLCIYSLLEMEEECRRVFSKLVTTKYDMIQKWINADPDLSFIKDRSWVATALKKSKVSYDRSREVANQ